MALALARDIYIGGATERNRERDRGMERESDCGLLGQMMRLKVNLSPYKVPGCQAKVAIILRVHLAFFLKRQRRRKAGRVSSC